MQEGMSNIPKTVSVTEFMGMTKQSGAASASDYPASSVTDMMRVPSKIPSQPSHDLIYPNAEGSQDMSSGNGNVMAHQSEQMQQVYHSLNSVELQAQAFHEYQQAQEHLNIMSHQQQAMQKQVMRQAQAQAQIHAQQAHAAQLLMQREHEQKATRSLLLKTSANQVVEAQAQKQQIHQKGHAQAQNTTSKTTTASSYTDKREGLLKGNLKVVYEQVGELFRENKSLKEQVELSNLKISNLEAMLEEKEKQYEYLLEKVQTRATCSNEDFGEKLAMLGLDAVEPASRNVDAVTELVSIGGAATITESFEVLSNSTGSLVGRNDGDDSIMQKGKTVGNMSSDTHSLMASTATGFTSSSSASPTSANESISNGSSTRSSTPKGVSNTTCTVVAGFTAGSRTKSSTRTPRPTTSSRREVSSVREEQQSDSDGSTTGILLDPLLGDTAFAPLKMMPEGDIFAKLNRQPSATNMNSTKSFANNRASQTTYQGSQMEEFSTIRSAASSATSAAVSVTLPPGLALEHNISASSAQSFSNSNVMHQQQSVSLPMSVNISKVHSSVSLAQTRDQLIYLCRKHDVDVRTLEWFLLPENAIYWETLAMKLEEIDRRATMQDGHFKVKNPSAWLTKFFNTIRKHNGNTNDPSSQSSDTSKNGLYKSENAVRIGTDVHAPHTPMREFQSQPGAGAGNRVLSFFPKSNESN